MPDVDRADGTAPRIRWVTSIPPDHDGGGGHIRQAHLVIALARSWPVDLVVAGEVRDPVVRAAVASCTEVDPVVLRAGRSGRRVLDDVRMATAARFHREVSLHARVRRDIAALWDTLPPAAVVCVEPAAMAPLIERRAGEHWSITLHNLRSLMAEQLASVSPRRRQRWLLERDSTKGRRFERWVTSAYDSVIVPSAADALVLGAECAVVPNGVDTDRFRPSPLPAAPRILFSGALYTGPNIDGARWLATDILPRVRNAVPDAVVDIVGLSPAPEVMALAELAGVTVHPDVDSLVPFVQRCRVAAVPLRVGTGTRLKALEAMASGRPVVGTDIGLAGLGLVGGTDVLVADDAAGFADALVRVLTDDTVASGLVDAASARVPWFGWDRIGEGYRDLVGSFLAAGPVAAR